MAHLREHLVYIPWQHHNNQEKCADCEHGDKWQDKWWELPLWDSIQQLPFLINFKNFLFLVKVIYCSLPQWNCSLLLISARYICNTLVLFFFLVEDLKFYYNGLQGVMSCGENTYQILLIYMTACWPPTTEDWLQELI